MSGNTTWIHPASRGSVMKTDFIVFGYLIWKIEFKLLVEVSHRVWLKEITVESKLSYCHQQRYRYYDSQPFNCH